MFIETIKYNVQQNSLRLKETLYSSRKMFDWLPLRLLAKYGELIQYKNEIRHQLSGTRISHYGRYE